MAYTKTAWQDRAVQNPTRYRLRKTRGGTKNMVPPFTDPSWTIGATATVDPSNQYKLTLVNTGSGNNSTVAIPVTIGQTYTITVNATIVSGANIRWNINRVGSTGALADTFNNGIQSGTASITFTADASIAYLTLYSTAAGTFTFSNAQMELGSVATTFEEMYEADMVAVAGTVTQTGTPLNAANMNNLEQGIMNLEIMLFMGVGG